MAVCTRGRGAAVITVAVSYTHLDVYKRQKVPLAYSIIGTVAGIITLLALFRMFSRNLEKRRAENAKFMEKVWAVSYTHLLQKMALRTSGRGSRP